MQQGGKGELLSSWVLAALVSNVPQVLCHRKCYLVELSSMDTFLPHDKNQCWSTQKEKKEEMNRCDDDRDGKENSSTMAKHGAT